MACTGPITEEGKAISARNALRNGATSRAAVLPWEDQAQYDALLADLVARHTPRGEQEVALVRVVATTLWRYMRLLRVEAEFMSAADCDGTRPDAAVADLFADAEGAAKLRLVLRYLANASREYRTAAAELRRVQAERVGMDGASPAVQPPPSMPRPFVVPTGFTGSERHASQASPETLPPTPERLRDAMPTGSARDEGHTDQASAARTGFTRAERRAGQASPETLPPTPERLRDAMPTGPARDEGHVDQASAARTGLTRAERRAAGKAQRKAEKRARQAAWARGRNPDEFVSYSGAEAA